MKVTMNDGSYYHLKLGKGCGKQICEVFSKDGSMIGYAACVYGSRVLFTTAKDLAIKALA